MGVQPSNTFHGAFTPVCNDCGIALCWDISQEEYEEKAAFWNAWKCSDCKPDAKGARKRWVAEQPKINASPKPISLDDIGL